MIRLDKEFKTQWHPAFCSALKLDLEEYSKDLYFESEHILNTKPLQIDMLVVKRDHNLVVDHIIGEFFRTYNIIEYKSPDDSMGLNELLKAYAYAYQYKTSETHVDDIKLEEITITMIRERYPRKLFKWLEDNNYNIVKKHNGVYYIVKDGMVPTQIIITNNLSDKNGRIWLSYLKKNLTHQEAEEIIDRFERSSTGGNREFAESVMQVVVKANQETFKNMNMEEGKMCEALYEIFQEQIQEKFDKAVNEKAEEVAKERAKEIAKDIAEDMAKDMANRERVCFILNMLKNGGSIEQISALTGISVEEIEDIKNQMCEN